MTENQEPTIDEAVEQELCDCVACLSVPLTSLALEIETPIAGWGPLFEELEIREVTDHIGRRAIPAVAARRLLSTLRNQDRVAVERHDAMFAKLNARRPALGGVPAVDGMSPYESMVAAGGITTPEAEFGGRPKPRFLQDELAAGARADNEKKRLAAERKKQRLVDQAQDRLGGKQ